jgi:hypothetical protein
VFLLVIIGASAAPIWIIPAVSGRPADWLQGAIILSSIALLLGVLIRTTVYSLGADGLTISYLFGTTTIPYDKITKVERSNSLMSAPAYSLKRLAIHFGRFDSTLVSPKDEARFLAELKARAPQITIPEPRA